MSYDYDLFVIGSGSAGGSAALAARELGKKVAVAEKYVIGGECPNFACVPTKALLRSAKIFDLVKHAGEFGIHAENVTFDYAQVKARKDKVVSRTGARREEALFEKKGIDLFYGSVKFIGPNEVELTPKDGGEVKKFSSDKFVIACGSVTFVPPIDGLAESGFITNEQAIDFTELPKVIGIMGGGPVGCEFAEIFSTFGAKVYIFEKNPRLIPREDEEISHWLMDKFVKQGVEFVPNVSVVKVSVKDGKKVVTVEDEEHHQKEFEVDELLVAAGKRPAIDGMNLEAAGVLYTPKAITVDETLKTSADNIYAAGDVVGPFQFTHTAHYQGWIAGHNLFSDDKEKASYGIVPRCVFTNPEIASVGQSESDLKSHNIEYKVGKFPISALGKANASEEMEGFVKILADKKTDMILGGFIVADAAGEMIHEVVIAMAGNVTAKTVADAIHAYPTFSEAVKAAAGEASFA